MRFSVLCREAWRDIVSGVARLPLLGALSAVVLLGGLGLDLFAVGMLIQRAEQFQAAGAAVITVYAPARIDGEACESLNRLPDVRASGALRETGRELTPELLPLSRVSVYETTRSFPGVVRSDGTGPGMHLSRDLAQTFDLTTGEEISFAGYLLAPVAGVYAWDDTDGRRGGYGYAALIPVDTGAPFDECWVDLWPVSRDSRELLLLAAIPGGAGEPPQLGQLNTTLGTQFDAVGEFRGRPTRWVPLGVALCLFGLGFGAVRRRRLEIVSDLHAGLHRDDMYFKHLLVSGAWALTGACLSAPVVAVVIGALPAQDRAAMAGLAGSCGLLGVAAVQCGTAAALALIRQRHFFAYFQQR